MTLTTRLRRQVVNRARKQCEYCGLAQAGQEATFHVDHVIPLAEGGDTSLDNLALACVSCSLRKGARLAAPDPDTAVAAPLFNPRIQNWHHHFRWKGFRVIGLTATGRATLELLKMNRHLAQAIRAEEKLRGRHPPS